MLYYLSLLESWFSPLRVMQYLTVRTVASAGTAFLVCLLCGPAFIRRLKAFRIGQQIRTGNAPKHQHKQDIPTMGGVLIVFSILLATLMWARPSNPFVLLAAGTTLYMSLVGAWDDILKIRHRNSDGLSARMKLFLQLVWAAVILVVLEANPETAERLHHLMVPFRKAPLIDDMGYFLSCLLVFGVLVGATNGVNLTDGLDGLAIGCTSSASLSYLLMAYWAGNAIFADYLYVPYVRGAGELAVFCGAIAGASLGFLWHNCHPAKVFMGDTGSLALGGGIAAVAVIIKQEIVLIVVGGVFVAEMVSVILQVSSYKLTGRRIFLMTPIHHHFEKLGWSETQITIRFWILSIICALAGLLTLKLR